jgi:hypothetical protein
MIFLQALPPSLPIPAPSSRPAPLAAPSSGVSFPAKAAPSAPGKAPAPATVATATTASTVQHQGLNYEVFDPYLWKGATNTLLYVGFVIIIGHLLHNVLKFFASIGTGSFHSKISAEYAEQQLRNSKARTSATHFAAEKTNLELAIAKLGEVPASKVRSDDVANALQAPLEDEMPSIWSAVSGYLASIRKPKIRAAPPVSVPVSPADPAPSWPVGPLLFKAPASLPVAPAPLPAAPVSVAPVSVAPAPFPAASFAAASVPLSVALAPPPTAQAPLSVAPALAPVLSSPPPLPRLPPLPPLPPPPASTG